MGLPSLMPPLPPWEGFHPLIVHFPVALLFTAPVLLLMGLVNPAAERRCTHPALALMALGTAGAYLAFATGLAASGVVADIPNEASALLSRHAELAGETRMAFTFLTVLYALLLFGPRLLLKKEPSGRLFRALNAAFLALYGGGMLLLVWTADKGGHLVHEFGIRAMTR